MAIGRKTGGRVVGTPNRKTRDVEELLESFDCNPIRGMAEIARNPEASLELRGRMYADLAQYVFPKRKAVEHSGVTGGDSVKSTLEIMFVRPPGDPEDGSSKGCR